MNDEIKKIEDAIAALEAQRSVLGDAIVAAAVSSLQAKLTTLRPQPKAIEQRKLVTILFADLVGFQRRTEQLDPEEMRDIMRLYFDAVTPAINTHRGIVEKFIGDAIMAVFGLPQSQENDPERAILAALQMQTAMARLNGRLQQQYGFDLGLRVGVNTGSVIASFLANQQDRNFSVIGDTVNTASRLEKNAPVGSVLISHDTYRHVRGIFDVKPLGALTIRGKEDPLPVYQVLKAKSRAFRLASRGVEGIETRMIGRDVELQQLRGAFLGMREGQQTFVTIVGEAGIGKTRLLHEFEEWIELYPDPTRYFKGRASPEMQQFPYAMLRDLFLYRFQIQDSDDPARVRQKIEAGFGEVLGTEADGQMQAHFIGQMLGFDFRDSIHLQGIMQPETAVAADQSPVPTVDAQQLQVRATHYLTTYFQKMSQIAPTVIILEDIHWADASSLDIVEQVATQLQDAPILFLCLTRPHFLATRPSWGNIVGNSMQLELSALSKAESRHLVIEILKKLERVPEALREMVVSGAEGNPFYVEELIKMLIEDGVIIKQNPYWRIDASQLLSARIPATLTGVLQARLDSLSLTEHRVLQLASVIGRTFWDEALRHLSQTGPETTTMPETAVAQALQSLIDKEMIFLNKESSFMGAREYTFKHSILREVTYESVLRRERRQFHARTAAWLIQFSGERILEYTGLIAEHLELAENINEALVYLIRAGQQAAAQFANNEAVNYLSRALNLLPANAYKRRYKLLVARERIYDVQGQRDAQQADLAVLETLLDQWQQSDTIHYQEKGQLALRQANFSFVTGDFTAAAENAQLTISLARNDPQLTRLEAAGYLRWGHTLWNQGDYDAARPKLERALELARQTDQSQVEASSLRSLGAIAYYQGDTQQAELYVQQAITIYRAINDQRGQSIALNSLGAITSDRGDYLLAHQYLEQAVAVAQAIGDKRHASIPLVNMGINAAELGNYHDARIYYEQYLQIKREIGDKGGEVWGLNHLGVLHHQLGNYQEAQDYIESALTLAQTVGDRNTEADAQTYLGHVLLQLGHLLPAETAYRAALTLRQEMGQGNYSTEPMAGLAETLWAQGEKQPALDYVKQILIYLQEEDVEGLTDIFAVFLTCYQILIQADPPRASQLLQRAYSLLQQRAARINDRALRRSYLQNVRSHREIIAAYEEVS